MKAIDLKKKIEKNWWHEVCATIDNYLEEKFNNGAQFIPLFFEHNYTQGVVWRTGNNLLFHEAVRKRVEERLERNGFIVMKADHTALNGSSQNITYISLF